MCEEGIFVRRFKSLIQNCFDFTYEEDLKSARRSSRNFSTERFTSLLTWPTRLITSLKILESCKKNFKKENKKKFLWKKFHKASKNNFYTKVFQIKKV